MNKIKKLLIAALGVMVLVCMSAAVFVGCNGVGSYKLTVADYNEEQGTVEILPNRTTFTAGSEVTVKVTPKEGFELKSFKLNSIDMTQQMVDGNGEFKFALNRNRVITADFQEEGTRERLNSVCKVNVNEFDKTRGSFSVNPGKAAFAKNADITFTVKAASGYELRKLKIYDAESGQLLLDAYDTAVKNNGSVPFTITGSVNVDVGFQTVEDYSVIEHIDADVFYDKIDRRGKVLVDFWATWCGPCKALLPHIETLASIQAAEMQLKIYEVDIDKNPDVFYEYAPQFGNDGSIPFLVLFEDGVAVKGNVGYIDYATLVSFVKNNS